MIGLLLMKIGHYLMKEYKNEPILGAALYREGMNI